MNVRAVDVLMLIVMAVVVAACMPSSGDVSADNLLWSYDRKEATRAIDAAFENGDVEKLRRFDEQNPLIAIDFEREVGVIAHGRALSTLRSGMTVSEDFVVGRVIELPSTSTLINFLAGSIDGQQLNECRFMFSGDKLVHWAHYGPPEAEALAAWKREPWWPSEWSPYNESVAPLDEGLVERFITNVTDHRGVGVTYSWLVDEISEDVTDAFHRRVAAAPRAHGGLRSQRARALRRRLSHSVDSSDARRGHGERDGDRHVRTEHAACLERRTRRGDSRLLVRWRHACHRL